MYAHKTHGQHNRELLVQSTLTSPLPSSKIAIINRMGRSSSNNWMNWYKYVIQPWSWGAFWLPATTRMNPRDTELWGNEPSSERDTLNDSHLNVVFRRLRIIETLGRRRLRENSRVESHCLMSKAHKMRPAEWAALFEHNVMNVFIPWNCICCTIQMNFKSCALL